MTDAAVVRGRVLDLTSDAARAHVRRRYRAEARFRAYGIAAIGFAIGSSYAGKTAVTITSGPGLALKTEFIGLAIMAEVPLIIINVQRGGPSTGLPTKVEQSDLLAVLYGQPGDSPKIDCRMARTSRP